MKKLLFRFLAFSLSAFAVCAAPQRYGLNNDGITDNSVALSNLFNVRRVATIPAAGTYRYTNALICNYPFDVSAVNGVRLLYSGPSNVIALDMRAGNSKLRNLTLDCNQWWNYGSYTGTIATAAGAISVNAIGNARLENITVNNSHGKAVYVAGSDNIFQRSNNLVISTLILSNVYDGLWFAQSNYSEFCLASDLSFRRIQNRGLFIGSANITINGGTINGYVDIAAGGGDGIATGTGVTVQPSLTGSFPRRSHGGGINQLQVAHFLEALRVVDAAGPVQISGGIYGGCGSILFSNCIAVKLDGVTMELWGENKTHSVNIMQVNTCSFINGTLNGWFPWSYSGENNTLNGVPMASGGFMDVILKENLSWFNAKLGTPGNTTIPVNYIAITNNGARYYLPAYQ